MLDLAVLLDLGDDLADGVHGDGEAIPTLPPVSLSICELTPMTSPFAFRSGRRSCRG